LPTPRYRFLQDEWLSGMDAAMRGIGTPSPGADARVHYRVELASGATVSWGLMVSDGVVVALSGDALGDPDCEIQWCAEQAFAILSGDLAGVAAAKATTIVEDRAGDRYMGPAPPLDLGAEPALRRMPRLAGADLTVHYRLGAAPFGLEQISMIVRDGQLERMAAGWVGKGDVSLEFPYRQLMLIRRGEVTWQDALQHGGIGGSIDSMVFLAAIVESGPYQAATKNIARRRAPMALATLGEVMAHEEYRHSMAQVMAGTAYASDD
jgi:hypothetical protein